MDTLSSILSHRIVAILRGADPADLVSIARALHAGGLGVIEVTLNSAGALEGIREIAARVPGVLVGAGTVLDVRSAHAAVDAGAKFVISPHLDPEVIRATKAAGAMSIPGAFTPTEILTAHREGGDLIKVFPASAGPGYIRQIRGPFPDIPLMPTGGVNLGNIREFFQAGARAVGIGSALVAAHGRLTDSDLEAITEKAKQYVAAIS